MLSVGSVTEDRILCRAVVMKAEGSAVGGGGSLEGGLVRGGGVRGGGGGVATRASNSVTATSCPS